MIKRKLALMLAIGIAATPVITTAVEVNAQELKPVTINQKESEPEPDEVVPPVTPPGPEKPIPPSIINHAPIIEVKDVKIKLNSTFDALKHAKISDKEDKFEDLKVEILGKDKIDTNKVGTYKVTYKVTDKGGATTTKTIRVTVVTVNNTFPTIVASDVSIKMGETFDPLKYVDVNDKEDGKAVKKGLKVVKNTVDTKKPGVYKVVYEVTDKDGAKTNKEIKVTVVGLVNPSNTAPVIEAEDVKIELNSNFDPLKYVKATDKEDGIAIMKSLEVIENKVNTNKVGTYNVTYKVTDKDGATATKTIKVVVTIPSDKNTAPIIIAEDVNLKIGDEFNPLNHVNAFDKEDGKAVIKSLEVVANTVDTSKAGIYTVIYRVTDKDGEVATKKINVMVNDKMVEMNNVPTIDAKDLVLKVGDEFNPLKGVTAFDKEDGSAVMKSLKVLENTVDTSKAGTYKVIYEVTDKDGAKAIKQIKVTVNDKMIEMNNAPTIDAKDLELNVGDKFDPLNHVTAFDKEDGKAVMKGLRVLENTVDTSKAGTYKVVYEVTDKDGAKTTKEIKVTVKENNNGNGNNNNGNNNNGNNNNNNNNGNTSTKPTKPNTNLPQTGAAGVGLLGMGIISTLAGLFVSKKKKK